MDSLASLAGSTSSPRPRCQGALLRRVVTMCDDVRRQAARLRGCPGKKNTQYSVDGEPERGLMWTLLTSPAPPQKNLRPPFSSAWRISWSVSPLRLLGFGSAATEVPAVAG
ncbi:unnamed protein product [Prorocentrum cordatum]|uniref:Uncharacterized protein n=1 Tax=Prorocentrum cordatum TaxID=2364126 RepID=A0ABN9UPR2_9DINO|nr:unnamed protein product [Polarella glacialis]